jgi:hypothetical protein
LLKDQDVTGKWKRRRGELRLHFARRDPNYMPKPEWLPALSFLFPKIGAEITSFVDRTSTLAA